MAEISQPGHVSVDLSLNQNDMHMLLSRLKSAVDQTKRTTAAPAPPVGQQAHMQAANRQPLVHEDDVAYQRRQAVAEAPPLQQTKRQAAQPPLPPPQQPQQQPVTQQRQVQAAPVQAQPSQSNEWRVSWSTEAADHDGSPVTAIAFAPALQGLPGGDGHGGWLISASSRMLNLWECSAATRNSQEPGLMLMHSQMTDSSTVEALEVEASSQRLLVATRADSSGEPQVATHSLAAAEVGFLTAQPALLLRPARPPSASPFRRCSQVVSLHGFGGPLTGTCAAAFDTNILVLPMTRTGARPVQAKAEWRAHAAPITCLHRSAFAIHLFSGSADGRVHMFDLKAKPSAPNAVYSHGSSSISSVLQVRQHLLAAAGEDGRDLLFDTRTNSGALGSYTLDGGPITAAAASATGDSLMAATAGGVYHLNLGNANSAFAKLPRPSGLTPTALAWSSRTGCYYAASRDGSITCFSRVT